jgi:hypothetical protein
MTALIGALQRPDNTDASKERQTAALEILARLGPDATPAVPAVVKQMRFASQDTSLDPRRGNDSLPALVLVEIGPGAVPELIDSLAHPLWVKPGPGGLGRDRIAIWNWNFRISAERVLDDIGSPSIPVLHQLLAHENERVRREAAAALQRVPLWEQWEKQRPARSWLAVPLLDWSDPGAALIAP